MDLPLVEYNHPKDHGWAYVVVFAAGVSNFVVNGGLRTMGIVFVYLMEHYNSTGAKTTVVTAILAAGFAILAFVGNIFGVRFTMRKVAVVGSVLVTLGFLLTAVMPSIVFVMITLGLIVGIGYGMMFGPSMVLIGQYCPKKLSMANGLAVSGGSIGQLVLPFFIGAVMTRYMYRGGMLMYSGLLMHSIPAMLLMRPPSFYGIAKPTPTTENPETTSSTAEDASSSTNPLSRPPLAPTSVQTSSFDPHINGQRTPFSPPALTGHNASNPRLNYSLQDGKIQEYPTPGQYYPRRPSETAPYFRRLSTDSRPSGFSPQEIQRDNPEFFRRASVAMPRSRPEVAAELNVPEEAVTARMTAGLFFKKICDPVLVCNPVFIIYVIGMSLGHSGFLGACTFIAPYIKATFESNSTAELIIVIMGVGDLVGRIGGGLIAQWGIIRKTSLVGFSFVFSGLMAIVVPFFGRSMWVVSVFAVLFGMLGGTYMAQIVAIVDELFGSVLLASSVGLSTLGMGLAAIPIMMLLGFMPSFAMSVRCAGLLVMFGGGLFYVISLIGWWRMRKSRPLPVPAPDSLDQKPAGSEALNADSRDGNKDLPGKTQKPEASADSQKKRFESATKLEENLYPKNERGFFPSTDSARSGNVDNSNGNGNGNYLRTAPPGYPQPRDLYYGLEAQDPYRGRQNPAQGYPPSERGYGNPGTKYPLHHGQDQRADSAGNYYGNQQGVYGQQQPPPPQYFRPGGYGLIPSQDPGENRSGSSFGEANKERSGQDSGRPQDDKNRWSRQDFRWSIIPNAKESELL